MPSSLGMSSLRVLETLTLNPKLRTVALKDWRLESRVFHAPSLFRAVSENLSLSHRSTYSGKGVVLRVGA